MNCTFNYAYMELLLMNRVESNLQLFSLKWCSSTSSLNTLYGQKYVDTKHHMHM